jgi:hypothetical protein
MPMRPALTAPSSDTNCQLVPMRRALAASRVLRSAMNRTMMCGWPK